MSNERGPDLYALLDQPEPSSRMGGWAKYLGRYSEVVGYSRLGWFFLRDAPRKEYLVLHPLLAGNNAKAYGTFESLAEFESRILKDPLFIERFLRPRDVQELRSHLGDLGADQVYFPVPYPCLGGSGDLSTYAKGDVWVFADILRQTLDQA